MKHTIRDKIIIATSENIKSLQKLKEGDRAGQ